MSKENINYLHQMIPPCCGKCGAKEMHNVEHECKSQDTEEWEKEFVEYFDKTLNPKKPGIKNLDRELILNFLRIQIKLTYEKGLEQGKFEIIPYKVAYKECRTSTITEIREVIKKMKPKKPMKEIPHSIGFYDALGEIIN